MHRDAAGGFAEHRDVVGIAAERRDVALDPLQRGDLIHAGVIAERRARALPGQRRVGEEPESSESIVEADEQHTPLRELAAIVDCRRRPAVDESAAIDPDHHRQRGVGLLWRPPDVQHQAVFARFGPERRGIARKRLLHAVVAEGRRRPDAGPGDNRLRRFPPQIADRRRSERDPLEREHAVVRGALHGAAIDADLIGERRVRGLDRPGQRRHGHERQRMLQRHHVLQD